VTAGTDALVQPYKKRDLATSSNTTAKWSNVERKTLTGRDKYWTTQIYEPFAQDKSAIHALIRVVEHLPGPGL